MHTSSSPQARRLARIPAIGLLLLIIPIVALGRLLFDPRPAASSEPPVWAATLDATLEPATPSVLAAGPAVPPTAAPAATPFSASRPAAPDPPASPAVQPPSSGAASVLPPATLLPPIDPSLPGWVRATRETGLWSGVRDGVLFTKIPSGSALRVIAKDGSWFRIFYSGDRSGRAPGEAWADTADLAPSPWPRWVRTRAPLGLYAAADPSASLVRVLKPGEFVEITSSTTGFWSRAYVLGDGRAEPVEGWLPAIDLALVPDPEQMSGYELTRDIMTRRGPDVWLKVPYQSQLDDTPYSLANCGPTTVAMVLEGFGVKVSPGQARKEALALQGDDGCDDCGLYIQHLAGVVQKHGLKPLTLYDGEQQFHHWTLDEIRNELRAGHPVLAQVFYRRLPGRTTSAYFGDHYVVVHGLLGDNFLINDPVDTDGNGYSRVITAQMLDAAMKESDFPYAAFAVSR
ncbi:MAG: C39 family peptidase [Chloroflexi bacterium]|nr:C39 family peptidase [Chloroflexota bacterium]